MMFMTPIPPTKSEIPATAPSSSVNVPVTVLTVARIELGLKIVKSASAGVTWWRAPSIAEIWSSALSTLSDAVAWAAMLLRLP